MNTNHLGYWKKALSVVALCAMSASCDEAPLAPDAGGTSSGTATGGSSATGEATGSSSTATGAGGSEATGSSSTTAGGAGGATMGSGGSAGASSDAGAMSDASGSDAERAPDASGDAGDFTVPKVTWPSAACQAMAAGLVAKMTKQERAAQMV